MIEAFVRRSECVLIVLRWKANANHPLMHQTGILSRADVGHVVVTAREDEVVQRAAAPLEPCSHRFTGRIHELELNRSLGLLLNDDGTVADTPTRNYVADPHCNHVTSAQLAVDCEIKQGSVPQPIMLI